MVCLHSPRRRQLYADGNESRSIEIQRRARSSLPLYLDRSRKSNAESRWARESPLAHPPGEAQADFGEAAVWLQDKLTRVAYFVMSLPYSDAFFCQVFPRECTETFQEGHCRAFQFFGGVPTRISYDNSRIAVAKFVGRRGDTPTREFLRLESHFLFAHRFCLVRRANEKGHVEGLVGFARRNFMVPVPRIDDLEEFNEQLARWFRLDGRPQLQGHDIPPPHLDRYASLLPGGAGLLPGGDR
ncbi:MAG: IS21 family transposase [Pirellulales bacterium]